MAILQSPHNGDDDSSIALTAMRNRARIARMHEVGAEDQKPGRGTSQFDVNFHVQDVWWWFKSMTRVPENGRETPPIATIECGVWSGRFSLTKRNIELCGHGMHAMHSMHSMHSRLVLA